MEQNESDGGILRTRKETERMIKNRMQAVQNHQNARDFCEFRRSKCKITEFRVNLREFLHFSRAYSAFSFGPVEGNKYAQPD